MKSSKTPLGWLLSSFSGVEAGGRDDGRLRSSRKIPLGWVLLILILFSLIVWTFLFKLFFH